MPFKVKQLNPIDASTLDKLGVGVKNLAKYTVDEFGEVASALQGTEPEVIWYKVPPKPRRGTIVYADGTNWNPGFGEGPYFYNGTSWLPLFTDPSWLTAWTSYTPSLAAQSGSYTSASAVGRYKRIGKTCHVDIQLTFTTVGTGTYPIVGLPVQAASFQYQWIGGREVAVNGYMWQGQIAPSATTTVILRYDNGTALSNGYVIGMSGAYETV